MEQDDERMLERVRADVEMDRAFFNHAGASPVPRPVLDTVHAHLDLEARLGGYEAVDMASEALEQVPVALGALIGAQPSEVAVTSSATQAWRTIAWTLAESLPLTSGDRVLVDRFTHATIYSTLRSIALARGIDIVVIPSTGNGTVDFDALGSSLDERTRLVVITHMPTHLGTVTDVTAAGAILRGSGVLFAVDIAQTLGQIPIDVETIGCDIAFAPGRKFLRAPRGTGVLYVRAALAERLVPLTISFGAIDPVNLSLTGLPSAARRFDELEFGVAAHLGLGAAATYAGAIGIERIARLVAARSATVIEMVNSFGEIHLTGTPTDVGIISFMHDRLTPDDVQRHLSAARVSIWVNPVDGAPLDGSVRPVLPSVRVSPHYLTTDKEMDRLEHALRGLERG